jgi:hypothetical protein
VLADLDRERPAVGRAEQANSLVPHNDAVRGFVCEVAMGALQEVLDAKAGP